MKNKKYHTTSTASFKSNRKIVSRDQLDSQNTHIQNRPLSMLSTSTSISSGGAKRQLNQIIFGKHYFRLMIFY